jgi:hypothetical protein
MMACLHEIGAGFSFQGEPREPFKTVIETLKADGGKKPIVSVCGCRVIYTTHLTSFDEKVDIPSAWDVEKGNVDGRSFVPRQLNGTMWRAGQRRADRKNDGLFFPLRCASFLDRSQAWGSSFPGETPARRTFRSSVRFSPFLLSQ